MGGYKVPSKPLVPVAQTSAPRVLGIQSRRTEFRCAAEQERKSNMSLSDILSFEVYFLLCISC